MKRVLAVVLLALAFTAIVWRWFQPEERSRHLVTILEQTPEELLEVPALSSVATRSAVTAEPEEEIAADAEDEELPPTPEHPGPGQARLRIAVVAAETGKPIRGAELALLPTGDGEDGHEWLWSNQQDPSRGLDCDFVVTDAEGRCEFIVQADYEYTVGGRGANGLAAERELPLDPFLAGEERVLRLELATAWTFEWHGRVVDGEHGGPIPGVEVAAYARYSAWDDGRLADLHELARDRSDGDGRVVLTLPGFEPALWLARDPARFLGGAPVDEEASTFETAQALVLHRSAVLGVLVTDERSRPAMGVDVRLSVGGWAIGEGLPGLEGFEWVQRTDEAGRCEFSGLPPRSDLLVRLSRDGGVLQSPVRSEADRLDLQPGRRTEVHWVFASTTSVLATVRTEEGLPLGTTRIGLKPMPSWSAEATAAYAGRVLTWYVAGSTDDASIGTTDDTGRVRFTGVPGGWCLIGPLDERVPGTVTPVLVSMTSEEVTAEVVVDSGGEIRGRILGPSGEPVRVDVHLRGNDLRTAQVLKFREYTEEDGSFVLGPLIRGAYLLEIGPDGDPFHRGPEPVSVVCPAVVEFRLLRAGGARGVVVDRDGQPVDARVRTASGWTGESGEGTFDIGHLAPGRHDLIAWDGEGRIGVLQGVRIAEDAATEGLVIQMQEGAEIEVVMRGERPSGLRIEVEWNGTVVDWASPMSSDEISLLAPPGEVVLRWMFRRPDGSFAVEHEERHTLAARETRTIEHELR